MVLKRIPNERENDEPEPSRRRLSPTKLCGYVTFEELQSIFEPLFRKTVRDAVDESFHALFPLQRGVYSLSHDEARRGWMLCFVKQPPPNFFTGNKVQDKDGAPLQVEIVDVDSRTRVTAAPLSSLKLEIVALDGDFVADPQKDPGEKYFNSHIVRAREGKKPLMTGVIHILLKDGVGFIRDICFTDNSRWTRSAKFRLGVRVLQSSSKRFGVREAVSDAIKVKDRRGEACMKHPCLSLYDEVWRLTMIRRNGKFHKRLESIKITTVMEFLQMLDANPPLLKETLKCGNSNRIWDTIVKHATSCLDKGKYEDLKVTPKAVRSLGDDLGVHVLKDRPFSRTSLMYPFQQVADDLELYTSNNGINQVPVDGAPNFSCANLQSEPLMNPSLPLHCLDFPITYPDQQGHALSPFAPSSSNFNGMDNPMEVPLIHPPIFDPPQLNNFLARPSRKISNEELRHCWLTEEALKMPTQPTVHYIPDDYGLSSPLQFSGSFSESDLEFLSSILPYNGSPKTAWCKLRAAVLCCILIRLRAKKAAANSVFSGGGFQQRAPAPSTI